MARLTDPNFVYRTAVQTDIRQTIAAEMRRLGQKPPSEDPVILARRQASETQVLMADREQMLDDALRRMSKTCTCADINIIRNFLGL
jgi:hypothetical protein